MTYVTHILLMLDTVDAEVGTWQEKTRPEALMEPSLLSEEMDNKQGRAGWASALPIHVSPEF